MVHVYTVGHQPATDFRERVNGSVLWYRFSPRRCLFTSCCGRRRWAGNCTVQVYYDKIDVWCVDGKGCKR